MKKLSAFILALSLIAVIGGFTLYREEIVLDKKMTHLFALGSDETNGVEKSLDHHQEIADNSDHPEAHQAEAHQEPAEEDGIVSLTDAQIQKMGLKIQTAAKGEILLNLSTRGKIILDPDRLAHIIPKVSGIAKEARKNIGNSVKQGEIIAVLESLDIASLKAAYLAAISKEKLNASILEREARLYQKGVSAGEDFFNAQNAYNEAQINLQLALNKLLALGLHAEDIPLIADDRDNNLRLYTIYAPMDGSVIMRHITQGEYIENTATIYEIADLSHVWVEVGIYPKDLHRLQEGQIMEVTQPDTHQTAEATLVYISPIIANETLTAQAIALLDNSSGIWRPGSFVKASITTRHIACPVIVPKEAIQKMDGKDYAFIATQKGFEKRELQLGESDQHNIEVISGIAPGERYVANRSFLLKAEMNKGLSEDHD